jgi:hypothetical protein
MKTPEEYNMDFDITFKTQHGKNDMIFIMMEFLGYYYPPHTDDCYKEHLMEIYRKMKSAKVEEIK